MEILYYSKTYIFVSRRSHCVGFFAAGGQHSKATIHIRPSFFGQVCFQWSFLTRSIGPILSQNIRSTRARFLE